MDYCKSMREFPLLSCKIRCCSLLLEAVLYPWDGILWRLEVILHCFFLNFLSFFILVCSKTQHSGDNAGHLL